MIRIVLCLALLFTLSPILDAGCGGRSGRGGIFSRRAERRQSRQAMGYNYGSSYDYGSSYGYNTQPYGYYSYQPSIVIREVPSYQNCAPSAPIQAPPLRR